MTTDDATYLTELHQLLNQYFNLAEIRTLCLRLNVDYESVPGEEKSSRIRELLLALGRRDRLVELIALLQQERPRVHWPPVPEDFELPAQLTSGHMVVPGSQYHVYGDVVEGDKFSGDKVVGKKIVADTYVEKQVVAQGIEITDIEDLPPEPCKDPCVPPYQGLPKFDVKDHERFFGRESLTIQLVNRLHETRFLAVVGASGSGKSSVVRAGVVPAMLGLRQLEDGTEPPLGEWRALIMTPTARPLAKLAKTLFPDDNRAQSQLYESLVDAGSTNALAEAINGLFPADNGCNLLLVVDQFEELFTSCQEVDRRQLLVDNLLTAVDQLMKVRIIITLRADFYDQAIQLNGLDTKLEQQQTIVTPMRSEELVAAILRPAELGDWKLQPGLMEEILADVGNEPGALPLLSHALLETWVKRHGRIMTLSGYVASGGVKGAIAQTATQTYDRLTPGQKKIAKQVFLRLAELGQGTQVTRRRVELAEMGEDEAIQDVLNQLADARLVTKDKGVVEVAHEALIREWRLLQEWLSAERDGLIIHRRLTNAAQRWQEHEKDPSYLYAGLRLTEADLWSNNKGDVLNDLERAFLAASSRAERKRQRTRRLLITGGSVVLAVLIMLGIGTFLINNERNEAITARETAVAAQATSEVNASIANIAKATAEIGAISERNARSTAVFAQGTAQADARRANIAEATAQTDAIRANRAEATAVAAQSQTERQRQIISLIAQSQNLMNVRVPGNQAVAQARLMAVAATQIDQEATGGQNSALLTPWNYRLTRFLTAPYQSVTILADHRSSVNGVAWHPNGRQLASASEDDHIIIWDTTSWQPQFTLADHTAGVNSVAWHPDGSRLASASKDETVIIWDTTSWRPIATLTDHTAGVNSVAWHPDGGRLASASSDNTVIIWDTTNWQPLTVLADHLDWVLSVAWHPDGSRLASASEDGSIIIWDTTSWQPLTTLSDHTAAVNSVAWHPDGSRLASASDDNRIIIWDSADWQPLTTLSDHTDGVNSVTWHPDGSRLASASFDNTAIIWDTTSWQPLTALTDHLDWVFSVAWHPDGDSLASTSCGERIREGFCRQGTIIIWDTAGWQPLTTLAGHMDPVHSVAWRPDGSQLASASDSSIIIWDTTTWQPLTTLYARAERFRSVAWHPDGNQLASALGSNIVIWDAVGWQPLNTLDAHRDWVTSLAWHPDGSHLASGAADGTIIIWQADENQPLSWRPFQTLTVHRTWVWSVAWNPQGRYLASADDNGCVILWDPVWLQREINCLSASALSVAWHPSGSHLATTSRDNNIFIWAGNENQPLSWRPFVTLSDHLALVTSVDWSSDGSRLASASADNTVIIWDAISWQPLTTLNDHSDNVNGVAWNDDGHLLASASADDTVLITIYEDSSARNCELARRNFSWDEWQRTFPNEDYRVICDQWPAHPSVPAEGTPESPEPKGF